MPRNKRRKNKTNARTNGTTSPLEFFGVELPPELDDEPGVPDVEETPEEPSAAELVERANRRALIAAAVEAGVPRERRKAVGDLLDLEKIPRDEHGLYTDEGLQAAVGGVAEEYPELANPRTLPARASRFTGEPPGGGGA